MSGRHPAINSLYPTRQEVMSTPPFEEIKQVRTFDTGATRDDDETKPDYEGYLSPLVIRCYGEYMTKHRKQADGKLRGSDNWQKGIPYSAYFKSLWRHLVAAWALHRFKRFFDHHEDREDMEEALCAIIFNASGYLHEMLKAEMSQGDIKEAPAKTPKSDPYSPEDF